VEVDRRRDPQHVGWAAQIHASLVRQKKSGSMLLGVDRQPPISIDRLAFLYFPLRISLAGSLCLERTELHYDLMWHERIVSIVENSFLESPYLRMILHLVNGASRK